MEPLIYQLWDNQENLTEEQIQLVFKELKSKKIKVKYCFYQKESTQNKQLAVVYDLIPNQSRRTGVENNWEVISTRLISDSELIDYVKNYFQSSYKRFLVFYYENIDKIIYLDKKFNVNTPESFIDESLKRGYKGNFQIKMTFE
jgi:hypothetical protein